MTEVEPVLDFASSGRSGRRNALPDILGSPAGVNPGDLPLKLAELNLKGDVAAVQPEIKVALAPLTGYPKFDPPPRLRGAQRSVVDSWSLSIKFIEPYFLPCTDGPGGAQSPSAEDPPAPPESSEGKEGS